MKEKIFPNICKSSCAWQTWASGKAKPSWRAEVDRSEQWQTSDDKPKLVDKPSQAENQGLQHTTQPHPSNDKKLAGLKDSGPMPKFDNIECNKFDSSVAGFLQNIKNKVLFLGVLTKNLMMPNSAYIA